MNMGAAQCQKTLGEDMSEITESGDLQMGCARMHVRMCACVIMCMWVGCGDGRIRACDV